MKLRELANITFSEKDVKKLCSAPPPQLETLSGTPKQVHQALDHLFDLWMQLVVNGEQLPIDAYRYTCPEGHEFSYEGFELRARILLTIGGYFESLYSLWLRTDRYQKSSLVPKAFKISFFSQFIPSTPSDQEVSEDALRRIQLSILSYQYFYGMTTLFFSMTFLRSAMPRGFIAKFELMSHRNLLDLFDKCCGLQGTNERILAQRLTKGVLSLAELAYSDFAAWNSDHKWGAFSALRLDELSLLAARDELMQKRYGRKHVETVFEQQLALLFQSFGLYVVTTRTGQSTIDIICISSSSDEKVTFLVEAKTSKAPYSLPKKDGRAIRDYVSDTKRSLRSLPAISFVMLVAASGSKTLESKLSYLEADAAVPIRFVTAQQLASLRERISGPLPLNIFIQELLSGTRMLDDALIERIAGAYQTEQAAHQAFVESMFSANGVIQPGRHWVTHENAGKSGDSGA